jgi:hypothetical protein
VKETAERLMDLAEAHIRSAGYAGFSFRDLAAEIGFRPRPVWLPRSGDVTRTDFSPRLRGGRMRLPTTLSPLTGQPSKQSSIETA